MSSLSPIADTLTVDMLAEMNADTIFAFGSTLRDSLNINWVAVRGGIPDWSIYVAPDGSWSLDRIRRHGDKCMEESQIRHLVPCDDEAFKMYRF